MKSVKKYGVSGSRKVVAKPLSPSGRQMAADGTVGIRPREQLVTRPCRATVQPDDGKYFLILDEMSFLFPFSFVTIPDHGIEQQTQDTDIREEFTIF